MVRHFMSSFIIVALIALGGLADQGLLAQPGMIRAATRSEPHMISVHYVSEYVSTHPVFNSKDVVAPMLITKLLFGPEHTIEAAVSQHVPKIANKSVVCYVEVEGLGPLLHQGGGGLVSLPRAFFLFEAHSGKVLFKGQLPSRQVSRSVLHPHASAHSYSPGTPAIRPRIPGTTGLQPGFTVDDVDTYVASHGFPLGSIPGGGKPTIAQIQFITASEARTLLGGENVGRPDDALVCYVQLRGPFVLSQAPLPPGVKPPVNQTGDMVFDAHTGNLLVAG